MQVGYAAICRRAAEAYEEGDQELWEVEVDLRNIDPNSTPKEMEEIQLKYLNEEEALQGEWLEMHMQLLRHVSAADELYAVYREWAPLARRDELGRLDPTKEWRPMKHSDQAFESSTQYVLYGTEELAFKSSTQYMDSMRDARNERYRAAYCT